MANLKISDLTAAVSANGTQLFEVSDSGITYKLTGAQLLAYVQGNLTLSNISDVTATAAELNKLDGLTATTLELNYVDGVTSPIQTQLDAKADSAGLPTAGSTSNRNKIINGNFDIWQRGTSFSGNEYGADRWTNAKVGSSATQSQQSFSLGQTDVPNEPTYYCRTVVTSSAGAGSIAALVHRTEDVRNFAGQTATLSFWAKADASKNIAVEFAQYFGSGGLPSSEVTGLGVTTCALTTSWQKFTVTVSLPSISGKTLGTDNNSCLKNVFWFDAGSDYNSRTNSLGQQSGTFDIAQVQLEAGDVATPFEVRSVGQELALCQRYYYTHTSERRFAARNNSTSRVLTYDFPNTMRAAPSITLGSVVGASFTANAVGVTATGFDVEGTTGSASDISGLTSIEADAEL